MLNSIIIQICALLYLLLLTTVYFSKRRLNTIDNKIYSITIFVNLFSIIFDIMSVFTIYYFNGTFLNIVVSKLYLLTLILWLCILTAYIFMISQKDDSQLDKTVNKYFNLFLVLIVLICSVYLACTKINFVNQENMIY